MKVCLNVSQPILYNLILYKENSQTVPPTPILGVKTNARYSFTQSYI